MAVATIFVKDSEKIRVVKCSTMKLKNKKHLPVNLFAEPGPVKENYS